MKPVIRKEFVHSEETELTFGKYKGSLLKDVIKRDPVYVEWCLSNISWFKITYSCKVDLGKELAKVATVCKVSYYDPYDFGWGLDYQNDFF